MQASVAAELTARAMLLFLPSDLESLSELQAQYEQAAVEEDHAWSAQLGHQFHLLINLAAGSACLALLMGSLVKQLPNRFYDEIEGQIQEALDYHPLIRLASALP